MEKVIIDAKKEERQRNSIRLNDLYGYEGEVFISDSGVALNYNSGYVGLWFWGDEPGYRDAWCEDCVRLIFVCKTVIFILVNWYNNRLNQCFLVLTMFVIVKTLKYVVVYDII